MEKKYRWVNDEVKIDFELPKRIQDMVDELEKMDEEDNWCYFDGCETLEYQSKLYVPDKLSERQWNKLCSRYCGG